MSENVCQAESVDMSSELVRDKAPYVIPQLVTLGDLRDLTLGTSRGEIESGATTSFRR
jgi:hypothetical protein